MNKIDAVVEQPVERDDNWHRGEIGLDAPIGHETIDLRELVEASSVCMLEINLG